MADFSHSPQPSPLDDPQGVLDAACLPRADLSVLAWLAMHRPMQTARLRGPKGQTAFALCTDRGLVRACLALAAHTDLKALASDPGFRGETLADHAASNVYLSSQLNGLGGASEIDRAADFRAVADLLCALGQRKTFTDAFWLRVRSTRPLQTRAAGVSRADDAMVCSVWSLLTPGEKDLLWRRKSPEEIPRAHALRERDALEQAASEAQHAPGASSSPSAGDTDAGRARSAARRV